MADRPLPEAEATMLSQPVVTGAIQLPPGGSPLLLMADRQTTGGYTIVAVVAAADLPLAGQLGPGDSCRFVPCEWEQARLADLPNASARARRDRAEDRMTPVRSCSTCKPRSNVRSGRTALSATSRLRR